MIQTELNGLINQLTPRGTSLSGDMWGCKQQFYTPPVQINMLLAVRFRQNGPSPRPQPLCFFFFGGAHTKSSCWRPSRARGVDLWHWAFFGVQLQSQQVWDLEIHLLVMCWGYAWNKWRWQPQRCFCFYSQEKIEMLSITVGIDNDWTYLFVIPIPSSLCLVVQTAFCVSFVNGSCQMDALAQPVSIDRNGNHLVSWPARRPKALNKPTHRSDKVGISICRWKVLWQLTLEVTCFGGLNSGITACHLLTANALCTWASLWLEVGGSFETLHSLRSSSKLDQIWLDPPKHILWITRHAKLPCGLERWVCQWIGHQPGAGCFVVLEIHSKTMICYAQKTSKTASKASRTSQRFGLFAVTKAAEFLYWGFGVLWWKRLWWAMELLHHQRPFRKVTDQVANLEPIHWPHVATSERRLKHRIHRHQMGL